MLTSVRALYVTLDLFRQGDKGTCDDPTWLAMKLLSRSRGDRSSFWVACARTCDIHPRNLRALTTGIILPSLTALWAKPLSVSRPCRLGSLRADLQHWWGRRGNRRLERASERRRHARAPRRVAFRATWNRVSILTRSGRFTLISVQMILPTKELSLVLAAWFRA